MGQGRTGKSAEGILSGDGLSASRSRPGPSGIFWRRPFGRPMGQVRDGCSICPVLEVGGAWGGRPGLIRGRMNGHRNRRDRSIGHGGSAASAHRALNRPVEPAHGLLTGIRAPQQIAHPGPLTIQPARGQGSGRGTLSILLGGSAGGSHIVNGPTRQASRPHNPRSSVRGRTRAWISGPRVS